MRFGIGIGLARAGGGQLAIEIGEEWVGERCVVEIDKAFGLGAKRLNPFLGVRDLAAKVLDLPRERLTGHPRLLLLNGAQPLDVSVSNRIGDARGEVRIPRFKPNGDDPRLVNLIDAQMIIITLKNSLVGCHAQRIFDKASTAQDRLNPGPSTQSQIEFRAVTEFEFAGDFARQIARERQLDLARYRRLVNDLRSAVDLLSLGPQEDILMSLDQHPCL